MESSAATPNGPLLTRSASEATDPAQTIARYQRTLEEKPDDADTHLRLAQLLTAQGQLGPATTHLREVLRLQPEHVEAHIQLGVSLGRQAQHAEAVPLLRKALTWQPENAKAWNNLGVALNEQGQGREALDCYQKAVQFQPDYLDARFNLAVALAVQRQRNEAIAAYEQVLLRKPDHLAALGNLGVLLTDVGRFGEAVTLLRQTVRLQPNSADLHNNLALALMGHGCFAEAEASYHHALRLQPARAELHNNLGTNHAMRGQPQEALACYAHALRLRPDYPDVHWHRALTWLQIGNFEQGWPEYEWRWKRKRSRPHRHQAPLWDGQPFPGKTLVLHGEQGMGDTIQFLRYVPLVKERGGTVILECPADLTGLLAKYPGIDRLVAQSPHPPPGDLQAPLLSLPWLFRTTLASIPASVPYLSPDPTRKEHWRQRLAPLETFKIGVFWQGNPNHRWDNFRSFPVSLFAPLAALPGVQLFSLQKGHGVEQLRTQGYAFPMVDLASQFADTAGPFTDAAAVLPHLDLVLGCDSALTHLAGALGVPTWVLLSSLSDWRWLRQRADTPWYPTLRLFRQRTVHDWDELFRRVVQAVKRRLRRRSTLGRNHLEPAPTHLLERWQLQEQAQRLRNDLRALEQVGDFGPRFLDLARALVQVEEQRDRLAQERKAPAATR